VLLAVPVVLTLRSTGPQPATVAAKPGEPKVEEKALEPAKVADPAPAEQFGLVREDLADKLNAQLQNTQTAAKADDARRQEQVGALSSEASSVAQPVPAAPPAAAKAKPAVAMGNKNSLQVLPQGQNNSATIAQSGEAQFSGRLAVGSSDGITVIGDTEADANYVQRPAEGGRNEHPTSAQNPVKQVATEPVSTFSLDVDTASYSFVRRALMQGTLPTSDAVRVEEMINYFPYSYAAPEARDVPFRPTATVMQAPWNPEHQLVHIGIKGYTLPQTARPRANLVFLIDVSGSMTGSDRLPLVQQSFRMLLDTLQPGDTVGIVTYAGESGIALEPTKVSSKTKILAAIDRLGAGGSTAGAAGINDAYKLAEANFDKEGVNRVILATDGDFNVGLTDDEQLKSYVEQKRKTGVFLSILGVGEGNYNDALMQTLAQNGNGVAAYVDTLNEARKVLVEEASANLFPIATDVKIQVEFNPAAVSEYRLIGYETRILNREDFNNDAKDAGDVGSGHTVTAIYEVTPVSARPAVDALRYGKDAPKPAAAPVAPSSELGFLKLRYKLPGESVSKLIKLPLRMAGERADVMYSAEVRFSTAVAAFGQLLQGGSWTGTYSYDDVAAMAQSAKGDDPFGYRAEFVNLVRLAKSARP
jgi:Ca-activated chloride channel homolog